MNCPTCDKEIMADRLFCIWCDAFVPNGPAGKKVGIIRRWVAWIVDGIID